MAPALGAPRARIDHASICCLPKSLPSQPLPNLAAIVGVQHVGSAALGLGVGAAGPAGLRGVGQDCARKKVNIDLIVPMTHQLIEDDRLLAAPWNVKKRTVQAGQVPGAI